MKTQSVVRNYYVLPCCLLLLNLCVELVSYKARSFGDPFIRTAVIMAMVLFGGSFVAFVLSPAVTTLVNTLHRGSRQRGGDLGSVLFLVVLGIVIFWLYYLVYIHGPQTIIPRVWWNGK
jgi:hypothetical protein